jgi:hypothetical protein
MSGRVCWEDRERRLIKCFSPPISERHGGRGHLRSGRPRDGNVETGALVRIVRMARENMTHGAVDPVRHQVRETGLET